MRSYALRCHAPLQAGHPVFQRRLCLRDKPLEYWIARSSPIRSGTGAGRRRARELLSPTKETRSRGAWRPSFSNNLPSSRTEGAGNAGCGLHPWSACSKKSTRQNHRFSRSNRHSLRNGFNGLYVVSPVNRAFLPPSPARRGMRLRELSASVGAPGPHDFAVHVASFV